MHSQHVLGLLGNLWHIQILELKLTVAPAALGGDPLPGMVDQNPSHRLGRYPKKVRSVFPDDSGLVHQPQPGFIDQGSRLEGVTGALVAHVISGNPPEFFVQQRKQFGFGLFIAVFQLAEK
jgi:hypothetical protein